MDNKKSMVTSVFNLSEFDSFMDNDFNKRIKQDL